MNIILICFGVVITAFIFAMLKILFQPALSLFGSRFRLSSPTVGMHEYSQVTEYERPSNSALPILPRRAHVRSHRNTAVGLPGNFNQVVATSLPQSLAIHKRILVNLNIMECQLAKLEQFLTMKNRPSRPKPRRRVTVKIPAESDSGSNQ